MNNSATYIFKDFANLGKDEIRMVWKWRNHNSIRKWMFHNDEFDFKHHMCFIKSLKTNLEKKYWLVIRNGDAFGVISIVDIKKNSGEWGYYIRPEFQGRNMSIEFIYYSLKYIFEEVGIKNLYGYTLAKNKSAISLNRLFGFNLESIRKEFKGSDEEYYYCILNNSTWLSEIRTSNKIERLLMLSTVLQGFNPSQS